MRNKEQELKECRIRAERQRGKMLGDETLKTIARELVKDVSVVNGVEKTCPTST